MNHILQKRLACFVLLFIPTCFYVDVSAATSAASYDYSHRKRDCEITVVSMDGEPVPALSIGIGQISNDFVFGGTLRDEAFDTLGDDFGEKFLNYFDVGIPENEMKWEYVMKCAQNCAPDFSKADSLVAWLLEKRIPIHCQSLFSNEKEARIPEWTRTLGTAAFKQAMQDRITAAMGHFKGKVGQWDLMSEICHGENGASLTGSMLETKSGDPAILSWILDEARKRDSIADFMLSDNGLITSADQAAVDQFIGKVKPLSGKFDIVGATGHFGANMSKAVYEPKINYLATQLGKPVVFTDVDFSADTGTAPDKLEELMRTCFANPKVGGLSMGSWCKRYMSGSNLTSYFIDSLYKETPCGQRWYDVRREWKTTEMGHTDDSGKYSFSGFQGKYHILMSTVLDTFYIEPGEGTKKVKVIFRQGTGVKHASNGQKTIEISINGITAPVKLPALRTTQLFLTTYSLSGQQLSRSPVDPAVVKHRVTIASPSCRVFRIETADRVALYTGKLTATR